MRLLIAPSEPPLLKTLGVSSTLPEVYGVDVCWQAGGGLCGVQRKDYCVGPETRVLTADLQWLPVSKVEEYDLLMGFDEEVPGPHKRRLWRATEVVRKTRVWLPAFRLVFDDGTRIVCSDDHRWLTYRGRGTHWTRTSKLQTGLNHPSRLVKLADVWDEERRWEAGYLAGAYDGEGHLQQRISRGNGNAVSLAFGQVNNQMLRDVQHYLEMFDFPYVVHQMKRQKVHHQEFFHLDISTRAEILRFLGSIRPSRLLENFKPDMVGQVYSKPKPKSVRLVRKEPLGTIELVGLTTTTGTFVAEGLASHNSDLVSSARDGRLQRLMTDMRDLDLPILLIEGSPRWTADGTLYDAHAKWSLSEHVGVILGAQRLGVWVVGTASLQDTVQIIPVIADWTSRPNHKILSARPGLSGDEWGNVTRQQRQEYILQGLPGIRSVLAKRIIDTVGFPLGLVKGEDELLTVPGVGKGTVRKMRDALQ